MFSNFLRLNPKTTDEDESKSSLDKLTYQESVPIVKKTWKELMRNEEEVGQKIYQHVLTKEISMSVLFINSRMELQSSLFMQMLDTVVGYLDDQKVFDEKLLELGEVHNKQYGVKPKHYKHFRTAFMKAIKIYIPWNERRENAWLWFWHRVIQKLSVASHKNDPIVPTEISPEKIEEYTIAIHESFDNAMEAPVSFGNTFYQALITEQKEVANLFSKTEFQYQSARFISMLQHAVRLSDEQSTFQNKIRSLSYQHREYGVKITQLKAFGEIFTRTLRSTNGDQWKSVHEEGWQWFWKIVVQLFRIGLEQDRNIVIRYSNKYYTSPHDDHKDNYDNNNQNPNNNNGNTHSNNNAHQTSETIDATSNNKASNEIASNEITSSTIKQQ